MTIIGCCLDSLAAPLAAPLAVVVDNGSTELVRHPRDDAAAPPGRAPGSEGGGA